MLRLAKIVIVLGFIAFFFGAISLGFLMIISGGDPVDYLRTTYLRMTLATRQEDLERSVSSDASEQILQIASGDTPFIIAQKLREQSLIVDAELFVDYMVVEGLDTQLQEGAFFLNQTMTIPDIAATITDRANAGILFVILPGTRIEEIVENIDQATRLPFTGSDFYNVVSSGAQIDLTLSQQLGIPVGASLEGFLFPDTYVVSPNSTATAFRDMVLQNFVETVGTQLLIDANAQDLSMRDVVTIASIAQREAVWDDEHVLITSVYRNRLDAGMKLDADPTVQYALQGARGRWWTNISPADYRGVESPYNTYLNFGLPPSPIANPSLSAIRAAIYPAESSYIYFRARCDGSNYHRFATTYDEHLVNGC
ncbi:MAG: endolytic transglycosylase MltG [Anaerolineae bacterium]|nr:endolytic transglycosylase MltG [Anaerolineae bacterium]